MLSAYFVTLSVPGMVLSYLWLIHHSWLRYVFEEDAVASLSDPVVTNGISRS